MATRLVLDLPDEFYNRIGKQLPVVKPEFVKWWIFDTLNKALNNTEARQRKTALKGGQIDMAMSDCSVCMNTPCTCGNEYEDYSLERLYKMRDMFDRLIDKKKPCTPTHPSGGEQALIKVIEESKRRYRAEG
jgi:hypothetical protein